MEQFSLEKYLENPNRKITTRYGNRKVRIICTDIISLFPIVAAIKLEVGNEFIKEYDLRGRASLSKNEEYDLFFADEKEELTEFDYAVLSIISDHNSHTDSIEAFAKRNSKKLLNLARKELEANYYTKVLDDRVVFKSNLHDRDMQSAYDMGKKDALKSLPKWKNINQIQAENHYAHIANGIISPSGYFISYDDLETLPKEE